MTTLVKMQISSLVSTMLTHWQKHLRMTKINTCNCSHPTWRPTSHTMTTKVSQTASWVLMHLLPWAQHEKWIPIGSMGCNTLYIKDHTLILCKILSVLNGRIGSCGWFRHFSPKPVPMRSFPIHLLQCIVISYP